MCQVLSHRELLALRSHFQYSSVLSLWEDLERAPRQVRRSFELISQMQRAMLEAAPQLWTPLHCQLPQGELSALHPSGRQTLQLWSHCQTKCPLRSKKRPVQQLLLEASTLWTPQMPSQMPRRLLSKLAPWLLTPSRTASSFMFKKVSQEARVRPQLLSKVSSQCRLPDLWRAVLHGWD